MAALEAYADKGVDLQKRWKGWHDERWEDTDAAENFIGKFPYRSIAQADQGQAEHYAAQDADVTWRLKHKMVGLLGRIRG